MKKNKLTTWLKKGIISFVLVAIVSATGGFAHPQKAHAQLSVFDSANFAENAISAAKNTISAAADVITSNSTLSLVAKEFSFDKIAFALAQYTLRKITNSILNWINSGFQGSPAFVQNFPRFIQDTVDEAFGKFIEGTEIGWICDPFRLDIQIALSQQHFKPFEESRCTITDIVDNFEGFIAGNFQDGGWQAWFELMRSNNNPYGVYNIAQGQAAFVTSKAKEDLEFELAINEGFISWEDCEPIDGGGEEDEQCETLTPGLVISRHLSFTLEGPQQALLAADEINEVILALFAQLAQQAITGAHGLLGLSSAGSGGGGSGSSPSYLDRLVADTGVSSGDGSTGFITGAIGDEQQYINQQQRIVNRVNDLEILIAGNRSCSGVPNNTPSTFAGYRSNAQSEINQSQQTIATLNSLANQFNTAATPEEQNEVAVEFATLQATGSLHTSIDVAVAEFEVNDRIERTDTEIGRVNSAIAACNSGGSGGGSGNDPGSER